MSQPKRQLETFRSWAGKSSDISYYLNSHHIDFCAWALQGSKKYKRKESTEKKKGIRTETVQMK